MEQHLTQAQFVHLHLQTSAISELQAGYEALRQQVQLLNEQQVTLTSMISEYEHKKRESVSPPSNRNDSHRDPPPPHNLQFNINMNHHHPHSPHSHSPAIQYKPQQHRKDAKHENAPDHESDIDNHTRWKNNPIIQTLCNMQHEIVSQYASKHNNNDSVRQLFANINRRTKYTPSEYEKLLFVVGSTDSTQYHQHHGIFCLDMYNKTKYKLSKPDPIISSSGWDLSYSALTVAPNVPCASFLESIQNTEEAMLLALRYGLSLNSKSRSERRLQQPQSNDPYFEQHLEYVRNEYLAKQQDHNEYENKDEESKQSEMRCSMLIRCGGCKPSDSAASRVPCKSPSVSSRSSVSSMSKPAGFTATTQVDALNLNTGDWMHSLPQLNIPRYGASVACSEKYGVFVVGGKDEYHKILSTVEQWDIYHGSKQWETLLARMNQPRYFPASCFLYSQRNVGNDYLFVAGGRPSPKARELKSCELYSFAEKSWKSWISDMWVPRYAAGCCVWNKKNMDGMEIIVGGGSNDGASRSVEIWNEVKNQWKLLPLTQHEYRHRPTIWIAKEYHTIMAPFHGMICIADENMKIEGYDPRANIDKWFDVEDLNNIVSLMRKPGVQVRGILSCR